MQCCEIQMWIQGAQCFSKNSLINTCCWYLICLSVHILCTASHKVYTSVRCLSMWCTAKGRPTYPFTCVHIVYFSAHSAEAAGAKFARIPHFQWWKDALERLNVCLRTLFIFLFYTDCNIHILFQTHAATQIFLQGTTDWNHRKWFADVAFLALQFPKPQE